MNELSRDIALWVFLDELKNRLRAIRDEHKVFTLCLRRTCDHFKVHEGCVAINTPDRSLAKLISVTPRGAKWDLYHLARFLKQERVPVPPNIIMAPITRRGRTWGVLALRKQGEFQRTRNLEP